MKKIKKNYLTKIKDIKVKFLEEIIKNKQRKIYKRKK